MNKLEVFPEVFPKPTGTEIGKWLIFKVKMSGNASRIMSFKDVWSL